MTTYHDLQQEHQALLARYEAQESGPDFIAAVQAYIERGRTAAADIADPRERDQLRANLRFWAAFIFDRTGVYPDTTLLPASKAVSVPLEGGKEAAISAPSKEAAGPGWLWPTVIVVGLLAVLSLVTLLTQALQPRPTPWPTQTTPSGAITSTPAGSTATPVPETPGPLTPTFTPTPTAEPATPTPTATPVPKLGLRWTAAVSFEPDATCKERVVKVVFPAKIGPEMQQAFLQLWYVPVEKLVSQFSFQSTKLNSTFFNVTEYGAQTEALYLVTIEGAGFPTAQVVVPFSADCTHNRAVVTFWEEQLPALAEELPVDPELEVHWRAVQWGPMPDQRHWVADLVLEAKGGNGTYMYWLDGERLDGNGFSVVGEACQPARHLIGVTSNGRLTVRELFLVVPYCP